MLFAGLEVLIEKNCALGLCTDLGQISGPVFLNTNLQAGK